MKKGNGVMVLAVYAFGAASVVFPLFSAITLSPVFNYFSQAISLLKFFPHLWAFVAGLNASALYLTRVGQLALARKLFVFSIAVRILTLACFGVAPLFSILAAHHIEFYQRVNARAKGGRKRK